jgi:hypothetical protein
MVLSISKAKSGTETAICIRDNSSTGCPKAPESTYGKTAVHSRETSSRVRETAMVFGRLTMGGLRHIRATTRWTKNQATEYTYGTTGGAIKGISKTTTEMGTVSSTTVHKSSFTEATGKMGSSQTKKWSFPTNKGRSISEVCKWADKRQRDPCGKSLGTSPKGKAIRAAQKYTRTDLTFQIMRQSSLIQTEERRNDLCPIIV